MPSILDKLNAGIETGTLLDSVEEQKPETTLTEDAVDIFRGATNQLGLMPVAQGVMSAAFDPLATALGSKATADANLDLSDKNILEKTIERFKYGYNQNKRQQKESEERNPLSYNLANIGAGFAIPAGALGNVVTKPAAAVLSRAPVVGKVGSALAEKGLAKTVANNAVEGAIGGAGFAEEGNEGSSAIVGSSIGAAVPMLGKAIKAGTPWVASLLGGANLKDARLYSKTYPEVAKSLENAVEKFDDIEKAVDKSVNELNAKYNSKLHDIGSKMSYNTDKIVQEQDKLINGVRNKLIDAQNKLQDNVTQASYNARNNLRKDAFVDISDLQKQLDDIVEESKINGELLSASNDTSMKSVVQIRDELARIAPDGKISEKDAWKYMHNTLNPLSKYTDSAIKGYTPPSVAVARKMRWQFDDKIKSANPMYAKAMKPTAEMTAFLRKELPDVIDLESLGSTKIIRNIGSNPEGLKVLNKLAKYTGTEIDGNIKRLTDVNNKLPSSFVNKDNLQMTGFLDKPGEGITVEQIQKTLKDYDSINKTDFAEQWNKARAEGKRDSVEALAQLQEASRMTDTDKKGMTYLGKVFSGYNPDLVDGNQSWLNRLSEGNEANPLNLKLAKDRKAIKATDLIADLTGKDKKELEKFARNLSLDKSLDTSATNGSRNVKLLGGLGTVLGGSVDYLGSDNKYDYEKNPITQAIPLKGSLIGGLLGLLSGGVRDYGYGNRLFKELVKLENKQSPVMGRLSEFLNRAATRSEGVKEYLKERDKQIDQELSNYRRKIEGKPFDELSPIELRGAVEAQQNRNQKYFNREG